ncbi:MAG: hypothetical protein RRY79_07035 [Clostridia bacterium]
MKNDDRARIIKMVDENRLSHAVFFSCIDDEISREAVMFTASSLLLLPEERLASSPVFLSLAGGASGSNVKVDDVDALITELQKCAFSGENRVIYAKDAGNLSEIVQNKLLKTLEEPTDGTFFLLSGREEGLLPTVRSRVTCIKLKGANREDVILKLINLGADKKRATDLAALSGNRLDIALKLYSDENEIKLYDAVVGFMKSPDYSILAPFCTEKNSAVKILDILISGFIDVLRLKVTGELRTFLLYEEALAAIASSVRERSICDIGKAILEAREHLRLNASMRQTLFSLAIVIKEEKECRR